VSPDPVHLDSVYLDWNATTPPSPSVLAEMERVRAFAWANPSSVHGAGRAARNVLEAAREGIGRALRVHPKDVIFTGGATEANHLALSGASSIVTTRIEHPSIARQAEFLKAGGRSVAFAEVETSGRVDLGDLEACLTRLRDEGQLGARPLVAVQAANHETGVIQPLSEVRGLCDAFAAELHVDAVQLVGRGPLESLQHADSLSLAAHKIRGPKGVGALAVRCGKNPKPLAQGGAQERGLRPGTQDAGLAAGFARAIVELEELRLGFDGCAPLRDRLEAWVLGRGGTTHGSGPRLAHVTNFRLPGWNGDELVAALDLESVHISAGSACAAGTAEPSPGIEAMLGRKAAEGAVRVSFGPGQGAAAVERLIFALERLERRRSPVAG
jgi:cysteine desulfurase